MSIFSLRTSVSLLTLSTIVFSTDAAFARPAQGGIADTRGVASVSVEREDGRDFEARIPLVRGWYNGQIALYLSTEASDRGVARATHTNFVPRLAGAILGSPKPVDDIYQVTNYKQGNVIPSAPQPAGPENNDANYTPLWQLSLVSWKAGAMAHLLRSEQEVLAAQSHGLVSIVKTNVVINCPVVYTPSGGILYGVRISH